MSGIYRGSGSSAAAQFTPIDGDNGDITVSNSGAVWTIDNGVVTTAKLGGDITTAGKALLDDADASAQRTTLGVAIGTDVQANLVSGTNIKTINSTSILGSGNIVISGVVDDGDKGDITVSSAGAIWNINTGVVTTTELGGDITTAGKALLDDADAAAQRTTLGLGDVRSLPINAQTAAYVIATTDNGKVISITTGGVTVNDSIMSTDMVVTIYNNSASSQTITQGSGVTLQWAGQATSTTGTRTLGLYGMATILFLSASSAVISGSGLT